MKSLKNANVKGKTVLVRADFNVFPVKPHELRIEKTIPTIKYLLSNNAKVILLTHIEENNGRIPSSKILLPYLKKSLPMKKITLFENLRKFPGEKKNSPKFAKYLASLGDIYVNEAFPASHREHASIVLLPKLLPSYMGFRFEEEIKNLSKVFNPKHPTTLILGGGKVETKLPILKKLLPKFDHALIGGVLLNFFIFGRKPLFSKKLVLPDQVIASGKKVLDVGPESFSAWGKIVKESKFIVWNGPLGYLEKGHVAGTKKLISILSKAKAQVIIGGGDTLACLPPGKKLPKNIFVSTGGGAMLEYLVHKTLPGIEALNK
ncbi:hypothetical protein A3H65_02605 [Candidatus Giovannonibacteria bacterium RIFCSPLOWO2_02_FULL_45_14]|uniref:Phosphoglycerate kinase n=3 Tax=Parcubacteria group TaxID=1794811 RepID=A0A0H4TG92_9BACT|nr:bifunctional phosphoglycerate kinase/triosephosphate isomerase, phosphoglycerate kinase / triosephosphate isomerase [uncultured Parcubacteria bacterium Rifle_16ft_4_minimus_37658]AKQ05697.1 bifunctional phosphoglycerate kinase/triosephosphate isomerase, phosphoglycerate kinase / triosephosphate isomerase [uncultured Parcubacteria bacterium Rifle_16ft_4_minimus_23641]OGF76948.1 MAG: hypothetical protein A3E62_01260 [Candidatus Giovannonibacteria bacterium RIFCSPHIGHO2_12_FULL_44_29]OGF90449.1 